MESSKLVELCGKTREESGGMFARELLKKAWMTWMAVGVTTD